MRSVSSAGVTAIVEWDCCECSVPSWSSTRAPASRATRTPALVSHGFVAEHDAGIQPALGGPGQVDRGRSEDPDPLCVLGEYFGEAKAQAVLTLRILSEGVLVDRDEGVGKRRRLAYVEPLAIGVGALP